MFSSKNLRVLALKNTHRTLNNIPHDFSDVMNLQVNRGPFSNFEK